MIDEDDLVGAIKIKDGLFIGDEFAAQVHMLVNLGFRVCSSQQNYSCH